MSYWSGAGEDCVCVCVDEMNGLILRGRVRIEITIIIIRL